MRKPTVASLSVLLFAGALLGPARAHAQAWINPDRLPSACQLYFVNQEDDIVGVCSGHLWNGSNIITAAHCPFHKNYVKNTVSPRGTRIVADCRIALHSGKAPARTVRLELDYDKVYVHRDYFKIDGSAKYSRFPVDQLDAAIIQGPSYLDGANQSVFSTDESEENRLLKSGRCFMSGFSPGHYFPREINRVTLDVYGKSVQIDATAHGDSGGGIFCEDKNGTYTQVLLANSLLGDLRMSHVVKLFPELLAWRAAKQLAKPAHAASKPDVSDLTSLNWQP